MGFTSFKNPAQRPARWAIFVGAAVLLGAIVWSCNLNKLGVIEPKDICNCIPVSPDIADFRHLEKHVPIPSMTPIEIDVNTILGWPQDIALPPDAPRTGRELQVFHLAHAFLQNVSVNPGDCDVHLEISQTADRSAPRVIVETPVDSEYCTARQQIQKQLQQHKFILDAQHGGELPQALPAEVLGLAFEDFEHNRGSVQVATVWEIHPATVTLLP